jgi:hypothetical protein
MTDARQDAIGRLRECPFCGSEADYFEGHRDHWRAGCVRCGVTGKQFANVGEAEAKRLAAKWWNTRTLLTALDGDEVRRLVQAVETVVSQCEKDVTDGYQSALRTYVLEMLRPRLNAIIGKQDG